MNCLGDELWARICKRLRRPGIDSEDSIPPAYVAWRDNTTNRVVIPASQAGNRFLGSLKGLQIRAFISTVKRLFKYSGIKALVSFPLKVRLKVDICGILVIFLLTLLRMMCSRGGNLYVDWYGMSPKLCGNVKVKTKPWEIGCYFFLRISTCIYYALWIRPAN
jgi:hypothetical protein